MLLTKKKVFKLSAVALVLCGAFSQSLASTSVSYYPNDEILIF